MLKKNCGRQPCIIFLIMSIAASPAHDAANREMVASMNKFKATANRIEFVEAAAEIARSEVPRVSGSNNICL